VPATCSRQTVSWPVTWLQVGLGSAEQVYMLTVRWPTGKRQVFRDFPVGPNTTCRYWKIEKQGGDVRLVDHD